MFLKKYTSFGSLNSCFKKVSDLDSPVVITACHAKVMHEKAQAEAHLHCM